MGASGTEASGRTDSAKEVGLDRTYPQETSIQYYTAGPDLGPAGKEDERAASQHLEARHRGRIEAPGEQLEWSNKSSPESGALASCR